MSVDLALVLAASQEEKLSRAHREIATLRSELETSSAREKIQHEQIKALEKKNRDTFAENRFMSKQLRQRSLLVSEGYLEELRGRIEWGEYIEEAIERGLLLIVPNLELEARIEHRINLMLGLEDEEPEVSASPSDEVKLEEEERQALAKILGISVSSFTTKEEALELTNSQ